MSKKKKTCYPINQLCKVIDCEHKTAPYVELSEYLVVRTNNVRSGILVLDDIKYTTKESFIEWTQRAVPEYGDVLFTREAPAGETCLVPQTLKVCMGQRMVLLRPNKDIINSHFLSFYLTTKECRREIYQYVIGSTVMRINIDDILQIKIFCPPIAEQEKIASFLGAIDKRLTELRRKHELLQTYKRGVMQKIFSQEVRFKGAIGSEFPDWEERDLGDILDFKNGINADKSKYGSGKNFINVLDVINKSPIYYDSIIGSMEITEQEFEKNDVKYGDILFQRSSEIREEAGQSNIYLDKNQRATFGGFIIRGRPKIIFNPIYFNNLLKTSSIRKEITDRSGGSTRFNVGQDSLKQVPLLLCISIKEQEKIADFLTAIDQKIKAIAQQIDRTERFKKGLLQKMFV